MGRKRFYNNIKKDQYVIGIDPGFTGAISILKNKEIYECCDMPVLKVGNRQELNIQKIREILVSVQIEHVFIERCQTMPGNGVVSMGRYMTGYGILIGLCAGLLLRYSLIPPQTWKRKMMAGMPKEKEASVLRTNQLYPDFKLPRKKDHGRADSVLLALYGLSLLEVE